MIRQVKKLIAVLLLSALAYQCIGKLGVLAWYQANKQYIAAVLCENRDKPVMHCNGRCVLAKKLKQLDEEQPASESQAAKIIKVEIPQFLVIDYLELSPGTPSLFRHTSFYLILYHFSLIQIPFHPPPHNSPVDFIS